MNPLRLYYPHLLGAQRPVEPLPLPGPLRTDELIREVRARVESGGAPLRQAS